MTSKKIGEEGYSFSSHMLMKTKLQLTGIYLGIFGLDILVQPMWISVMKLGAAFPEPLCLPVISDPVTYRPAQEQLVQRQNWASHGTFTTAPCPPGSLWEVPSTCLLQVFIQILGVH